MLLTALAFVAGSCTKDKDKDDTPQPQTPAYLTEGTASRPSWTSPGKTFGNYMSVQVQLGDTLSYFQSEQDLMCASINGEIRTVTGPKATADVVYFPLTIGADDSSAKVTLQYYCDRLHRIYILNDWATFDPSAKPFEEGDNYYLLRFTDAYL